MSRRGAGEWGRGPGRGLVLLLCLAALALGTRRGRRLVDSTTSLTRTIAARFELQSLAASIRKDWHLTGNEPPVDWDGQETVRDHLRDLIAAEGARDTSLDPWGRPYGIRWEDHGRYLLYSLGPDPGDGGGCAASWDDRTPEPGVPQDEVCVRVALDVGTPQEDPDRRPLGH